MYFEFLAVFRCVRNVVMAACTGVFALSLVLGQSSVGAQTNPLIKRQFSPPDLPILRSLARVGVSEDWVVGFGQKEIFEPRGNLEVFFYRLSESGAEYHSRVELNRPISNLIGLDVRVAVSSEWVALPVEDVGRCKALLLQLDGTNWQEFQLMDFPQLDICRQQLAFANGRLVIFDGRFIGGERRGDFRAYLATFDGSQWSVVDQVQWASGACGLGGSMDAQRNRFVFVCNQESPAPNLIEEFFLEGDVFSLAQQVAVDKHLGSSPISVRLSGETVGLLGGSPGQERLFLHDLSGPASPLVVPIDLALGSTWGGFGGVGESGEFAALKPFPDPFLRRFSLEGDSVVFEDDAIPGLTLSPLYAEYSSRFAAILGLAGEGGILELATGQTTVFPNQPVDQGFGGDIAFLDCALAISNSGFLNPDGSRGRVLLYPTCQEEGAPVSELVGLSGHTLESDLGNLLVVDDPAERSLNLYEVSAGGATQVGRIGTRTFPRFAISENLILIASRDPSFRWFLELLRFDPADESIELVDSEILDTGGSSFVGVGSISLDGNEGIISVSAPSGAWLYQYIHFSFSELGLSVGTTTDWSEDLESVIFIGTEPLLKDGVIYDVGSRIFSPRLVRMNRSNQVLGQAVVATAPLPGGLVPSGSAQHARGSVYFPATTPLFIGDVQTMIGMIVADPNDQTFSEFRLMNLGWHPLLDNSLTSTSSGNDLFIGVPSLDRGNTRLPGSVWEFDLDVVFADAFEGQGLN